MQKSWASPYDWLDDVSRNWSPERVRNALVDLAGALDSSRVEAFFCDEMILDGYYDEPDTDD